MERALSMGQKWNIDQAPGTVAPTNQTAPAPPRESAPLTSRVDGEPAYVLLHYDEYLELLQAYLPGNAATDSITAPLIRAPLAWAQSDLLTAAAKQDANLAHLASEDAHVPDDGTIPQDVLEKVIQNRWPLPRAWREYLKLSKQEVAARADISDRRYGELEDSFVRLSKRRKAMIADGLALQAAQLLAE
jgi:hypothetical protein